jgi:hypothetical protein
VLGYDGPYVLGVERLGMVRIFRKCEGIGARGCETEFRGASGESEMVVGFEEKERDLGGSGRVRSDG